MNNPIWLMSSAVKDLNLKQVIEKTKEIHMQGIEVLAFRRDGTRRDHVACHLDYEDFGPEDAKKVIDLFDANELRLSLGAYDNLIGGDPAEQVKNQNHILRLIRMAHLLGGDGNDVKVGTFVGYNHELSWQENGFQKNLDLYVKIFKPIIQYAEDLGVTILYENCPMEGWRAAGYTDTYNNLPATLAARKLMYALIPSKAHGETYDPSHDVWQHIDPSDVIKASDLSRVHRVHVKATRNRYNNAKIHWGALYPMQAVNPQLAKKAGVPVPAHEWDRHHYEPMLPGFGGSDSMDWRKFLDTLMEVGFEKPFVVENEGDNSSHTGNMGATMQGFQATVLNIAPVIWPMDAKAGYQYDKKKGYKPLKQVSGKDIPLKTMDQLK
ncbi:sugar phosphate isomerase/epimerase [bacterium]|nr:sugar phosphate isomerase/epimerase [bacterium]